MLPQSAVFTSASTTSTSPVGDVLVLSSGLRRVLVPVPASYADLVALSKDTFNIDTDAFAFETDDLNICRGSSVEIHSSSWEAVRSVVGTVSVVVVKNDAATSSRRIRVSTSIMEGLNEQDVKPASTSARISTVSSRVLTEKQITLKEEQENVLPSSLDGDIETQVEDELFGETAEEDEEDEQLFRSPVKGKGRARARIYSDDENELDEPATSTLSAKHRTSIVSPRPSATGSRATPRDVDDIFSPARPVRSKKVPIPAADSSEENDENLAPPRIKLSTQRRVTPVAFEEEENDENAAPSPLRQSIARSEARISTSANPEVRSVKKTPHKANNYAAQDEVSPSPKPKFRPARSPQPTAGTSTHAPVQSSALRLSTVAFDADESKPRKVEPIAPLRETAPLPNEKILITIAHPESDQESKFKIKGKHLAERVISHACDAFKLDMNYARLMLEEEVDGIEMSSECDRNQMMISAGVRNGSYLVIVMDEAEEAEELSD
ncbi:hypothetical protein PENSPDRAFT_757807 [Peniophora sp. CONT]|nr:hypothetical protein PENSPDRAFT_757807 [Peniophora sp. CONT]